MEYTLTHLDELNLLIDKASAIAGSDNKLAAQVGTTRMAISDWRNGRRPCPPEQQALIAAAAGLDPQQTALRALVQRHEGTPMGDKLMRVLGKPSLAIGAALVSAGANAHQIFSTIPHHDLIVRAATWLLHNECYVK
jgi:DNA-binding transcriptional regulator YdaS (Cro superfamily)